MTLDHATHSIEAAHCDLSGSRFRDVNLSSAHFDDVNLTGAQIQNACLAQARFSDVNLCDVAISDCNTDRMTIDGIPVADLLTAYAARR